jgi:DNA-binding response OmpR family regulator
LIIDDAADVRKILKLHLENKYEVREAVNGEEGIRIINEAHPDLIILDINMPKMGGIEVYGKISAGSGKPAYPVIVLTVREELGAIFKDLNVDGFITKPFVMDKVMKEIDAVINRRYKDAEAKDVEVQEGPRKVLIVENDSNAFNKIVVAFLNAGYLVRSAKSGMDAIDKILADFPDLILMKLGLEDISGDIVCVKLKQMPRTMNIPLILYTPQSENLSRVVVMRMCEIAGTDLIETDAPDVLLREAERVLKSKRGGNP